MSLQQPIHPDTPPHGWLLQNLRAHLGSNKHLIFQRSDTMGGNLDDGSFPAPVSEMSPGKAECCSTTVRPPPRRFSEELARLCARSASSHPDIHENRRSFPLVETSSTELQQLLRTSSDETATHCHPETPKRASCVLALFSRMPSKNEPDKDHIQVPSQPGCHAARVAPHQTKYFLESTVSRRPAGRSCEEVIHKFRWVPLNACLRMIPFQAVTVGRYSYSHELDRDVYIGKKGMDFEEFAPLHELAYKYNQSSEGVTWGQAVNLTKEAEERADEITEAMDGQRAIDMNLHHGVIHIPGHPKSTYPRSFLD